MIKKEKMMDKRTMKRLNTSDNEMRAIVQTNVNCENLKKTKNRRNVNLILRMNFLIIILTFSVFSTSFLLIPKATASSETEKDGG